MKKLVLFAAATALLLPLMLILLLSMFAQYRYPAVLPTHFVSTFWRNILGSSRFYHALATTLLLGVCNGAGTTVTALLTARALSRYYFIGRKHMIYLLSLPLFIPSAALFIGVHVMMLRLGHSNSFIGVVLAHMLISVPYGTRIMLHYYDGIPPEMEDAARTLGCGAFQGFKKVLLPLLKPGIALCFSIGFLISASEYFSTFLIGGGRVQTLTFLLYPYIHNFDRGHAAVLGAVFLALNGLVFLLAEFIAKRGVRTALYLFE